jgi:hypothetical protein
MEDALELSFVALGLVKTSKAKMPEIDIEPFTTMEYLENDPDEELMLELIKSRFAVDEYN